MPEVHGDAAFEIPGPGAPLVGHLEKPALGHGRGVLVLHEAFGLVPHIREVCARLARAGFVALAPDLFRGRSAESIAEARELSSGLDPVRVGEDLEAAVAALLNHEAVDGSRVGTLGFCMGGFLALLAAWRSPRVGAAIDFYGMRLPLPEGRIEAAVLGIFAERDEFVSPEAVAALRAKLDADGTRSLVRVQPDVGHGFMNDSRPERYDAAAAAECWNDVLAFLRAELA